MDELIKKINTIISDARSSIKEESEKAYDAEKDEKEKKRIKVTGIHYEVMLSEILLYKKEIEDKVNNQVKMMSNTGVKIVLDEDPTIKENLSTDKYAYEGDVGAFVSDDEPFVVQTKSGKRIVLDSDPISYVSEEGINVEIDKVPKFKDSKKSKRIVLDQDPLSIKTKTGKKIILDEDPKSNSLKTNKVIVLTSDPNISRKTGKKIVLDEEPLGIRISDEDVNDNEVTIEYDKDVK